MIATTIISSISVKPFCTRWIPIRAFFMELTP